MQESPTCAIEQHVVAAVPYPADLAGFSRPFSTWFLSPRATSTGQISPSRDQPLPRPPCPHCFLPYAAPPLRPLLTFWIRALSRGSSGLWSLVSSCAVPAWLSTHLIAESHGTEKQEGSVIARPCRDNDALGDLPYGPARFTLGVYMVIQ